MSELKSTIVVDVDASRVETGVHAVKRSLNDLGGAATTAGAALGGIGPATEEGLKGADRATKSLVAQMKNAAIDIQSAGKAISEKFELKANARGLDPAIYKPYLDQLKAVEAAQASAAASSVTAGNAIAHTMIPRLNEMGMSAAATANAMRNVPAQFTDIIVSLQGGQKPLTVLLQQGGQLKDMFGGVGNAAKAMGTYLAGLINPFSVAAAAVGALGYAYSAGAQDAREFNKALILTGNAAGTTVGELQGMAVAVSKATGSTQGAAAEALAAFASNGNFAASSLTKFAGVAIQMQREMGVSVADTVKQFVELGKDPVAASVKLNDSTHHLTLEIYQQIKALEDQGRSAEAAALAQDAYANSSAEKIAQLNKNLGWLESAWRTAGNVAKWFWDRALDIGREDNLEQKIAKARASLETFAQLRQNDPRGVGLSALDAAAEKRAQDDLKTLSLKALRVQNVTDAEAVRGRVLAANIAIDKLSDQYAPKKEKLEKALTEARNQAITANLSLVDTEKLLNNIRNDPKFKEPAGPQAGTFKVESDNLIAQEKERAASRLSVIVQSQADAQRLASASVAGLLMTQGEYQKQELALITQGERDKLAQLNSAGATETAEYYKRLQVLKDAYDKALTDNKGKAGASEADVKALAKYRAEVVNLTQAEITRGIVLDDNATKVKNSADTLRALQLITLRGEIAKTQKATDDFWRSESENLDRISRQTGVEDAMRYASPAARANLAATSAEQERLTSFVLDHNHAIELLSASAAAYADVVGPRTEAEAALEKGVNDVLAARIKLRDALASKIPDSAAAAGARAVEKLAKDNIAALNKSVADAITTGLVEGGDAGARALREILIAELKKPISLVVQALIQPVTSGIAGALGVGGSAGDTLSGISSVGNIFSAVNGGLMGSMATGVSMLGNTFGSTALSAFGTGLGQTAATSMAPAIAAYAEAAAAATAAGETAAAASYTSTAAGLSAGASSSSVIPIVGWIMAGMTASASMYDQGHKWDGKYNAIEPVMGATDGVLQGVGIDGRTAAIISGSALIQGALDKIGSWFDGGHEYTVGTGVQGKFSNGGFSGRNYQQWQNDGSSGIFGLGGASASHGTNYSAMDSKATDALSSAFASIQLQTVAYATTLGLSAKAILGYSQDISVALGADAAANKVALDAMFKTVANGAAATVLNAKYIREGEGAADTLVRLSTNLTAVNITFDALGKTLLTLSQDSGDVASQLADAFGGLAQYQTAFTAYYQKYYSQEERSAKTREVLAKSLADVGLSIPDTVAAYRDLVNAQDVTTASGLKAFTALINLSGAFAEIADSATVLGAQLSATFKDVLKSLADLVSSVQDQRKQNGTAMSGLTDPTVVTASSIQAGIDTALAGVVSPTTTALVAAFQRKIDAGASIQTSSATLSSAQYAIDKVGNAAVVRDNSLATYNSAAATAAATPAYIRVHSTYRDDWGIERGRDSNVSNAAAVAAAEASAAQALTNYTSALADFNAAVATYGATAALGTAATAAYSAAIAESAAADAAIKDAQKVYNDELRAYVLSASVGLDKLATLREKTLQYYDQQKALADLMANSASSLRKAMKDTAYGASGSATQQASLQADFATALAMATVSSGSTLAGYADQLGALLPTLSASLLASSSSASDYALSVGRLNAQASTVATKLDAQSQVDYLKTTVDLLTLIDDKMGLLESSASSAQALIVAAIDAGALRTADGLQQVINALTGKSIAAFAAGGSHIGGLRIVGENGPELEATGPSRIWNAVDTKAMLSGRGSDAATVAELQQLRSDLRAAQTQTAALFSRLVKLNEKWDGDGLPSTRIETA